jgi:hypothetical protein
LPLKRKSRVPSIPWIQARAKGLIKKYRKKTDLVEWNDEMSFMNMDVFEDYEKIRAVD